jgi:uncharacterized protein (TIGR02145 family)
LAFAILLSFVVACSGDKDVAGGSSVDSGVVAITNKQIAGVAQKGPLVKGSEVVIRETSAEGNLELTGREYTTVTINDKGGFKFDSLDLESQYVRLSAEGYYIHDEDVLYFDDDVEEVDPKRSECPMRLDAVSDLRKRETVNINILTHFEYKRVLNLIKSGKSFAQAKKQAAAEVVGAFGVKVDVSSAEDLNIYNTTEADRILFNMSLLLDNRSEWDPWDGEGGDRGYWEHLMLRENVDCSKLQKYLDGFSDDFADDGILDDTLMQSLAGTAYLLSMENSDMEDVDEEDLLDKKKVDPESYELLLVAGDEYEFGKLLFLDYMGLERCTDDLWGEYRQFNRPIIAEDPADGQVKILKSGYFLCNGFYWELKTKGYIDSLSMKIEHGSGTMKDPRDGSVYKTVSFEYGGKKYEWMAEDLKYSTGGIYSWTAAMQIDDKYMNETVEDGVIDSVHQGICPDGWHIFNTIEWEALIGYVKGVNNLLDETWRTDRETSHERDLIGVFYNRFDFNLVPMDKKYLELYYHTYTHKSFDVNTDAGLDSLNEYFYGKGGFDEGGNGWISDFIGNYRNNRQVGNTTLEISVDYSYATVEPRKKARVRCVKN